jgi:hypothetical protein
MGKKSKKTTRAPDGDLAVVGNRVTAPTCAPGYAPTSRAAKATKRVPIAPGQTVEFVPTGCAPKKTSKKTTVPKKTKAPASEDDAIKRVTDVLVAQKPAADLATLERYVRLEDIANYSSQGGLAFGIAWGEIYDDDDYDGPLVTGSEVDDALARIVPACSPDTDAAAGFDCRRVRRKAADYAAILRADNAIAAARGPLTQKLEEVENGLRTHPTYLTLVAGLPSLSPMDAVINGLSDSRLQEVVEHPAQAFEGAALKALKRQAENIISAEEGHLSILQGRRNEFERVIADNERYAREDPADRAFYEQNTADLRREIGTLDQSLAVQRELVAKARALL